MLDARRQEVYLAGYDGQGQEIAPVQARIMHLAGRWGSQVSRVVSAGRCAARAPP
jgi:tRNA A37 threonylcarbamoyladenosine modification protein TsaB